MSWLSRLFKKAMLQWLMPISPGSSRYVWQVHLDKFFEGSKRYMGIDESEPEFEQDMPYQDAFGYNQEIFKQWLHEVPHELKMGDDLDPAFKSAVRQYVQQRYDFDPFEYEMEYEVPDDTPSVDELSKWWG